jgi:hypothetical protein
MNEVDEHVRSRVWATAKWAALQKFNTDFPEDAGFGGSERSMVLECLRAGLEAVYETCTVIPKEGPDWL